MSATVPDYAEDYFVDRLGLQEHEVEPLFNSFKSFIEPLPIFKTPFFACEGKLVQPSELWMPPSVDRVMQMAGFASYAEIIAALTTNGKGQRPFIQKTSLTTVAAGLYDAWLQDGIPSKGTFGATGTPNIARAVDKDSVGAIPFNNPTAPATMHLLSAGIGSTVSIGTMLVVDRLAEYPFNGTDTADTWTTVTLPSRDVAGAANGLGIMMFLENFSATATAAVTFTPSYTDSAGNAGNTSAMAIIASGTTGHRIVHPANSGLFYPLTAGDLGVRKIDSYTLSASALSTQMQLVLIRPLAVVPLLASNSWVERDTVMQLANLPRLYDGTALSIIYIANTTSSPMMGNLVFAEN